MKRAKGYYSGTWQVKSSGLRDERLSACLHADTDHRWIERSQERLQ